MIDFSLPGQARVMRDGVVPELQESGLTWWKSGPNEGDVYIDDPYRPATWRDFRAEGLWSGVGDLDSPLWQKLSPDGALRNLYRNDPHLWALGVLAYGGLNANSPELAEAFSGVYLPDALRGEVQGTLVAQSQDKPDFLDKADSAIETTLSVVVTAVLAYAFGGLASEAIGGLGAGASEGTALGTVDPVTAFDAAQGTSLFEGSSLATGAGGASFGTVDPLTAYDASQGVQLYETGALPTVSSSSVVQKSVELAKSKATAAAVTYGKTFIDRLLSPQPSASAPAQAPALATAADQGDGSLLPLLVIGLVLAKVAFA